MQRGDRGPWDTWARHVVALALPCLIAAPACRPATSSTATPGQGGAQTAEPGAAAAPGSATSPGATGTTAAGGATQAPAKQCGVELDVNPTTFFGRMQLPLPKGLELVEQNPFFARVRQTSYRTDCGVQVQFAAVGYLQDTSTALTDLKVALLEFRGIPREQISGWEQESGDNQRFTGAYVVNAGPGGEPPLKGWLSLQRSGGATYFVIFETDPGAWSASEATFKASAAGVATRN